MNKSILSLFFFLAVLAYAEDPPHAVMYEFSGGRFGDNLLSYLHAKWLSYRYGILLLYKPFNYSPELALHDKERRFDNTHFRLRHRTPAANIESDLSSAHPMLFICPYFPEDPIERIEDLYSFFDVDWKDEEFRKLALEMIAPKKKLKMVDPPKETINLAVHVRDGGNYDDDAFRIRFPLKLPPFSFYLEALPLVLEHFRGKKIYCHIFTDAEQPERIVETLKTVVPPGLSVKFGYRKGANRHNWNVLDDFFSFFQFDALIRPQSHFSMIPSLLHDFAILSFPSNFSREGPRPLVTKFEIEVNDPLYQKLLREK